MNQLGSALLFLAGLVIGGRVASGAIGDFLAIVGGCVGIGAGIGASATYLSDYEPRWDRGVGLGSIVGLVTGLCLAILDAGLGS